MKFMFKPVAYQFLITNAQWAAVTAQCELIKVAPHDVFSVSRRAYHGNSPILATFDVATK